MDVPHKSATGPDQRQAERVPQADRLTGWSDRVLEAKVIWDRMLDHKPSTLLGRLLAGRADATKSRRV